MSRDTASRPVLYFDGVCNLCNTMVQFVIQHDKKGRFLFASLQSQAGKKMIDYITADGKEMPDSVLLSYKGKYYTRSSAAIRVASLLDGFWPVLYLFMVIPPFMRNAIYNYIARHRYRWFGKKEECMIPTPELKARFL